jgi:hypothetical protein
MITQLPPDYPRFLHNLKARIQKAQARKVTRFKELLPHPQSDLAEQTLKDPYLFDFLAQGQAAFERNLSLAPASKVGRRIPPLGRP